MLVKYSPFERSWDDDTVGRMFYPPTPQLDRFPRLERKDKDSKEMLFQCFPSSISDVHISDSLSIIAGEKPSFLDMLDGIDPLVLERYYDIPIEDSIKSREQYLDFMSSVNLFKRSHGFIETIKKDIKSLGMDMFIISTQRMCMENRGKDNLVEKYLESFIVEPRRYNKINISSEKRQDWDLLGINFQVVDNVNVVYTDVVIPKNWVNDDVIVKLSRGLVLKQISISLIHRLISLVCEYLSEETINARNMQYLLELFRILMSAPIQIDP
jgi:hypothetical protein